jgi:hypothetical protein
MKRQGCVGEYGKESEKGPEKWQLTRAGDVMRHTDYRTLISRGRKAGLGTSELYRALAGSRPEDSAQALGQADGNGFVSSFDQQGHRVYHPIGRHPRP